MVDRGLTEIYHIRAERGKMPSLSRGANLEEAEIVVRCQRLIRGVRDVEKAGCEGPHSPPWKQF